VFGSHPAQFSQVGRIGINGEHPGGNTKAAQAACPDIEPAKLVGESVAAFPEADDGYFRCFYPRPRMLYYGMG
jgi:hypothetical protein